MNRFIQLSVLLSFSCFGFVITQIPVTCTKVSPCVCKDEYGRYVDLRPLARKDGTPRYIDVPIQDWVDYDYPLYSYNPCYGFNEGRGNSSCADVAVCKVSNNKTDFQDIGRQGLVTFGHFDNGNLSAVYTSKDRKSNTIVSLYCDETREEYFRVQGDMGNGYTWLQLWTKHACPKNESDIANMEEILQFNDFVNVYSNITTVSPLPTIPSPHSSNMTSAPDPMPATLSQIEFLLSGILFCVIFILVILVGSKTFCSPSNRVAGGSGFNYQPVPTEPQAYYDKNFGVII